MAQLSMHSIREVMAVKDVDLMITAFTAWFAAAVN
jgi:aspartyl aminopeptidase